jgi:hypothetical protein
MERLFEKDLNEDFLPRNEMARLAVLKSREIVRKNNDYIQTLKEDSNIQVQFDQEWNESQIFSLEDSYTFDLYKIKSKSSIREMLKDIFSF